MDMAEEMRSHIEMQTRENIEAGMKPEAARNAALREFGWVESVKETCREQRGIQWVETLIQDIRFAGRMLFKKPGFTVVVVLTLAVGIGANTAIFSVVNAVLLKPLPYRAPDRIVMLWANNPTLKVGTQELPVEALDLPEWQAQTKSFEAIAAFRPSQVDISGQGEPERLAGVQVTASLFPLLGVKPILGRTFSSDEEQPGNDKVAVISHALWKRRFGGDGNLVGQQITINGERRTVVGIMPAGFSFPRGAEMPSLYALLPRTEIWLPLAEGADFWHHDENRENRSLIALARIRPDVSLAQAQSEMNMIASRQAKEHPTSHFGWTVALRSLPLQATGETRPVLFLLLGVVTLVALIACANLASLFLCRFSARGREMAVRAALGAGRVRVVRQLLTESLIFCVLGGALGLLVGAWGIHALLRFSPADIPRLDEVSLDAHVLAFTALVAVLTGIFFSLLPALSASRVNLTETLKTESQTGTTVKRHRAHGLLVVGEVTLAVILLAGAGLLLKSFLLINSVAPGFDPHDVVAFDLNLTEQKYPNDIRILGFFKQAREELASLPGVQSAAAVGYLPLGASVETTGLIVEGRPLPTPADRIPTQAQIITPGYFATMGVTLLQGRDFTDQDARAAPLVCIINETAAHSVFAGSNPIGERIRLGDGTPDEANNPFLTIVGVARDVRGIAIGVPPNPEVYLPLKLDPRRAMTLVLRTKAEMPAGLEQMVRAHMKSLDSGLPVANYRSMEAVVSDALAPPRFSALLLSLFAVAALVLTVVGVYGVVSFAAQQRTHEIGIRIAVGASVGNILALILRQGMLPVIAGLVIGLLGALGLTRFLANQLYAVKPTDPVTFLAVGTLLASIALLACWVPARRATRIDPIKALRCE